MKSVTELSTVLSFISSIGSPQIGIQDGGQEVVSHFIRQT